MLYPENIEKKLDFGTIRTGLVSCCMSPLGEEKVDEMRFESDYASLCGQLQMLREMMGVLADGSLVFPQGEVFDIREALARIRVEGLFLDETELFSLRKTLDYVAQLERFFAALDAERFPLLHELLPKAGAMVIHPILVMIDRLLDRYGKLKDNASPELLRIRREITQSQGSVSRALQTILRQAQAEGYLDKDATPTMREGRLVLPVPPAYKRKIGGIVHDESATGKTVFIEPAQVVEANNHIRELESAERRERTRILLEVTARLRPSVPDILFAEHYLGRVDFLHAKALYGQSLRAIVPRMENQPCIAWKEARHPLLWLNFQRQGKEVVPLDIHLDSDHRILVISGPNAGGKSVCLKTVAILQYMLQCGLAVPMGEASTMGMFDDILIDIGDEQSMEDDLSTYSSHLRNMKQFVRTAGNRSLMLIDEFGTGTEPLIGGAIAEAVLCQLNQQGAWGVITTHYTNLKHLAEQTPGICNGAMLYDRGQLRPLFQLSIGQAGSSFAIEIARQIGLSESIIATATEIVGEEHIDYDKQLQDIARDKRYWENKRQNIRLREKHLEQKIAFYEQEIASLKQKQRDMLREAQQQAQELLQNSNATIERTIREIKEAKAEKEATKRARQPLEEMKKKVEALTPAADKTPTRKGETQTPPEPEKKKKKGVLHDLSELKVLSKNPSKIIQETNTPKPKLVQSNVADELRRKKLAFSRQLDMRGLRADEALDIVIAYIDDAIMVGANEVTILHGTGTGALKQVVRDYLSDKQRSMQRTGRSSFRFHDGDPDRGGAGLTCVEFLGV